MLIKTCLYFVQIIKPITICFTGESTFSDSSPGKSKIRYDKCKISKNGNPQARTYNVQMLFRQLVTKMCPHLL